MEHSPVLLQECLDALNIKQNGTYVDGTLGRGGHSLEIAKRLRGGWLIAIDRDADAIREASEGLSRYKDRICLVHGNYRDIALILDSKGIDAVDGMLFDLGVSSPQLEDSRRGFSYTRDAPLDMRMDEREAFTAYEAVNTWPEERLRRAFYEYGEERYAPNVARAIVKSRIAAPIQTTLELSELIKRALPAAAKREAQHPAKRCFQALRIAVNDELGAIKEMLGSAPGRLKEGGRICVVSFHSLEDRLVKNAFSEGARGCVCPKDLPMCVCGNTPVYKQITKKPITPGADELERNPRARSAKLRVAERIGEQLL